MVEIRIYGQLRPSMARGSNSADGVICLNSRPNDTVASLLDALGIPAQDVYTIFLNHRLLAARSRMARWMGHVQAGPDPLDWDLQFPVKPGDRIGLFGRDMAALVV